MPNILHRLSIDAPTGRMQELVATKEGVERWWTGKPVAGDDAVGGRLSVYFIHPEPPAAVFEVLERTSAGVRHCSGPVSRSLLARVARPENTPDCAGLTASRPASKP
jgi:hypothetical protein